MDKEDFDSLEKKEQKSVMNSQDHFFDRIYYELEYLGKIEAPKINQSFYYFFRQSSLATFCFIIITILLTFASLSPYDKFTSDQFIIITISGLAAIGVLFILVKLARWYRKKLVKILFWTYFTHLYINQNNSK